MLLYMYVYNGLQCCLLLLFWFNIPIQQFVFFSIFSHKFKYEGVMLLELTLKTLIKLNSKLLCFISICNIVMNWFNYDLFLKQLHTFADNTSINYASVNTSSYLHTYVERGGFVLDLTHWQDNSSGTPSNVTTLPLLKVTQRWEVDIISTIMDVV